MAAGLGWELGVVLAYFAVFVAGLSYAQWQTRGMKVYREEGH